MNMIPGAVRANGAGAKIEFGGNVTLPMPARACLRWPGGVVGMRPEHCTLADSGAPADVVGRAHGADTQLYCRFPRPGRRSCATA
jgi:hypothetical protein